MNIPFRNIWFNCNVFNSQTTVKLNIKVGGQKLTQLCDKLQQYQRSVVLVLQVYDHYGPLLTPLICKPANFFYDVPSFLHLHMEHLITLLDTICPSPVQLGPKLMHNLQMLQPSDQLIEQLNCITPFEPQMVKIVNALLKEAGSCKKQATGEDDGPEDEDLNERPTTWLK